MILRKIKLFIKFHWIAILISILSIILTTSLAIFLRYAIISWMQSESYFKRSTLANTLMIFYMFFILNMITLPVSTVLWIWVLQGGHTKFTRLHKKSTKAKEIDIHWDDVIGMDEAKQEAAEVVNLIKDRTQVKRIGGKILRGLLMIGPPGCGKTYLAKAIATEAGLPFLSMSGAEFVEMFVGVGASRMRKLFKQARNLAYTEGGCIIFIDELDAVGARRGLDAGFGGTTEHNTTLNQLLIEMDGLKEKNLNIVVMGATNASLSSLDQALLRPGRFDRKMYVELPNLEEREKLFQYYLKEIEYDPSISTARLARMSVYKSPADIANIIRESALIALRKKKDKVSIKEMSEALDRIEMGIKHKRVFSEKERKSIAYHEAGHAVCMYLLHPTKDVFKASIAARGEALGMVISHTREETHNLTKEEMLAQIKVSLGSYAAEKLKIGTTATGVSDDFKKAMSYATNMVWRYGMGKSGLVGDYTALDGSYYHHTLISEKIKEQLNNETQSILQECLKEVEEILSKESQLLDDFAQELLKKEELDYDEIEEIFKKHGKKPLNI